jgi:transposase InsO family protein
MGWSCHLASPVSPTLSRLRAEAIFHNRRRRHTALGMLTPTEYELLAKIDPGA